MSKKIITAIIALAAVCGGAVAQPKNAYCPTPNHRDAGKMAVIDTTRIRVWYAFNADNVKDVNTYIDQQRLDIGKYVTKYYSDFLFRSDSLIEAWAKSHPGSRTAPRFLGNGGKKPDRWSEYEYSDLFISNGKLTEYATMPQSLGKYNAYYTEPYPLQQWKMGTETQTILGHRCQKATCHWRGRDFVAWFSADIPVRLGPWSFGGLPGLILKLYDVQKFYTWEAVSLRSGTFPITKRKYDGFHKDNRTHVYKLQVAANRDHLKAGGAIDRRTGQLKSNPHPYEPLELE